MYAVGGTHRISKEGLGPIHQLTEEGDRPLHRLPPSLHSSQPVFRHRGTDTLSLRIPYPVGIKSAGSCLLLLRDPSISTRLVPNASPRYPLLPSSFVFVSDPVKKRERGGLLRIEAASSRKGKKRRERDELFPRTSRNRWRAFWKEGRKEGTVLSTGAKPHFRRAIHTGRRSVRVSPRKDIIPLGRGRVGRSTMVDGHRDRAKAGERRRRGNAKRSWPGPGRLPRFTNYSISPAN